MQGNLAQISLNDILLLATGGKKSGVLKLCRGKATATSSMLLVQLAREKKHCSIR
jgi:hypothetical protein